MIFLRTALGALSFAVAVSLGVACGAAASGNPALDKLVKEAAVEGTLNVVWAEEFDAPNGIRKFQDALNRRYGLHVAINFTPGASMPQVGSRILLEEQAGRKSSTDLYLGAETNLPPLMLAHALRVVPWSDYFPYITPEMHTKDGTAVLVSTFYNGITYNAEEVRPKDVPKTVAQIFKPQWKGKIATTPYAVGFDRLALWEGVDKVRPIVAKTAEWSGGLLRCGDYDKIASGEFIALFFDCGLTSSLLMESHGGPLNQVMLDDAPVTTLWYFAVPKNSEHPALATLLAGYLLSGEGQKLVESTGTPGSQYVKGTGAYKQAQAVEARGIKLDDTGPDDLIPHQKELVEIRKEFQRMVRK
ncbi:MAG: extracellular solute-binding protein [Stellaceae bacterium]